ncbi:aminodeoxychorismate synthase component I [Clostridium sp. MB40-C1]|uniref:aminodeoxychorismate synthase component I n=1 Tax=Clostridium sp. MB40-C1 TaxID=3070996 RepID=UPI0027E0A52F|nr:aminodeoxychorismate synthase component I [Clostridium sp. MB40-C1]WMJ82395.1 aminodeoxychorismate synthase component I [Clostridium sp. MB40-C1]
MNPLMKEITTELDSFSIYSIFKNEKESIFLDSGMDRETLGKYSFIGLNPFITFKSKNSVCFLNGKQYKGDAFEELKEIMKKYKFMNHTKLPFVAGGMGYFSYDVGRKIESLPNYAKEDIDIPDCYFNFYDNVIIIDHVNDKVYISALGILQNKDKSIEIIEKKILKGERVSISEVNNYDKIEFKSNFTKDEYIDCVEKVRDYIEKGDIYITNLTQRFNCKIEKEPYEIYKVLRGINPAPFAAYMKLEDFSIVCSSPERFLQIKNGIVETRPIKGTRPRGKNEEEDLINKNELLNSEKDKSELLMIVDLERNDLSKVCKPNSVKVTELFKLEEYSTVYHLVSTIIGELKDDSTSIDCVKACFPGGSITGAPKIRSMEIIDELEKVRRNIYTGSIGYIGFDNSLDLNIVIRTIFIKDNEAYIGVGGGITWESDSLAEYEETLDKAKALFRAIENID